MSQPTIARPLLAPFTPLYRLALALREQRLGTPLDPIRRLRFPVISIGNLSTGGAGKTPMTIALAKALNARGLHVDVLSRGYGRRTKAPVRVDPDGTVDDFGDEPLLIARQAAVPVYVAAQRYHAGLLAEGLDPDSPRLHLLDDGFQHRQLFRDVNILLINRDDWRDRLLPAGNLREPLSAVRRATILAIPADDTQFESELKAWGWTGTIWRLHRRMAIPKADGPFAAFCGIARPDQFFAGLELAGLQLAAQTAFPDHHRYTAADLNRLAAAARAVGATTLLTTEKDRVRIGEQTTGLPLITAGLRIEIEEEDAAVNWLAQSIQNPR